MGALDHLSDMCSVTETKRTLQIRKRRPLQVKNITVFEPFCFRGIRREIISSSCSLPLNLLRLALIISSCLCCCRVDQTVDLKVKMDCDGCERRVKHAVSSIRGVTNVNVNRKQSRVTVTGHIEAKQVLERIKSTGKRAELWPYVPYNLVAYPYVAGAYDKKAPSGFVRNAAQAVPNTNATEEQYMSIFSDENPNACSVM